MPTSIGRAVVGIEALRNAVAADSPFQFSDEVLNIFAQKNSGADDETRGIIENDVQIGFPFLFAIRQTWTVEKISHPKLPEIFKCKTSAFGRDGFSFQSLQAATTIEGRRAWHDTIPGFFL